ncbi:aromatic amino acid ammonia-lyase [Fulvivirga maritima]|uniref:HAL/PAL/TAL family ammonia-lyase n=1 Tax=Fulvivirga maritima TaxID=2904247 RepID=UPI001F3C38D2|nr:aromatic amino acid ammonia-lyase [Fulvivirga maritima]UII28845.1 aromatic amino acid ammonia-lyase [Fulvivirga maritima]
MVKIEVGSLSLADIEKVVFEDESVKLSDDTAKVIEQSHNFLSEFSKNKVIYGINTGFGPMAQYKINEADQKDLQFNLIRSHSSGQGELIDPMAVRASMLARLNTLSLGYSGVHESSVNILVNLINHNITPVIFKHGGVGASGDLVQLAHLALVMIGEGEVVYEGQRQPTKGVFEELGIEPMQIKLREGLAVMNGTSVMTGIGIVNAVNAQTAIGWSIAITAMICEMVDSYDDYFSPQLNGAKKHQGQQHVAGLMRGIMEDSKYIRKREKQLYETLVEEEVISNKVQEYYSLRCAPQILGAIYETIKEAQKLLVEEINSANDNPIVDVENQNVYHGGNFHGDYVAFEMDKLKIAVTKLSMLAERQLNFLMNPHLNGILPPFANLGKLGFNFGMQGVQFTATSTTAENQMLSNPMYIHSIPNNNDNQDIVSMGTNAASCAERVIENTFEVLAIEVISVVQALDHLQKVDGLSSQSKKIYEQVREIVPVFSDDYPLYGKIKEVKEFMMKNSLLKV